MDTDKQSRQQSFGTPPHERAAAQVKSHAQPGDQSQLVRPEKPRFAIVDEQQERVVQVLYSSVIYRPNQRLHPERDKRLIKIAEENGIALRYQE